MINIEPNILFLIIFSLLFFLLWLKHKLQQSLKSITKLKSELAIELDRNNNKSSRIDELNSMIKNHEDINKNTQKELSAYKTDIAELKVRLDEEKNRSKEKVILLELAEQKMLGVFENLSHKIFDEKSKQFTNQNKIQIGEILTPLKEQLGGFRKKIEDVYDKETKDRMSLYYEITNLKTLNEKMSEDAINLTNALKGENNKIKGDWGEMILEKVLEQSGLNKGREYEIQASYHDESNKLYRPDVVIHLPNNRDVIVDSKVSLNAYERYYSAKNDPDKIKALKEHILSIKRHITDLKSKNYDELVEVNSLDMVLMFIPIEPALMLALENDTNIFQDAFKNGIFLVSPSTLSMNLQIIQNMWRYEYQNKNAQEIATHAANMYDKFVGYIESLEDVGDKLNKAQIAYETAHNRLTEGKGNLIARIEKVRKLGELKTNKLISDNLINKSSPNN